MRRRTRDSCTTGWPLRCSPKDTQITPALELVGTTEADGSQILICLAEKKREGAQNTEKNRMLHNLVYTTPHLCDTQVDTG
jgi:hypothetical protein